MDLEAFAQDLALQGRSKSYINTVLWQTRRYLAYTETPATKEALLDYLAHLRSEDIRQSTIERAFSNLSVYFDYLVEIGELQQNPVPALRKRYLSAYKDETRQRQLISAESARKMVQATIDTRDRAVLLILLKTGIRRGELISLDVADVDLHAQQITLKPTAKRTNKKVFFDDEAARAVNRWLIARESRYKKPNEKALFVSNKGTRLEKSAIDILVRRAGERVSLHDSSAAQLEDKFTPHCCRHWFTTHLLRSGCPREHVQWLRGDAIREAVDIYYHIDPEDVRRAYLAHIPRLGI
jgi:integrase/recombinase XerD